MPAPTPTHLIVFAPATLHGEAWRALLSGQPDILVASAVADVAGLVPPDQPTTLLVDEPAACPDIAARSRAAAPHTGLLCLVESYDLAEIVALLRAGATGCIARDASEGDSSKGSGQALARAIIDVGRDEIALPW